MADMGMTSSIGDMVGGGLDATAGLSQTIYGTYLLLTQGPEPERPTYTRPGEIDTIANIAKARAYSDMPGYESFAGDIGGARAAAITEGKKSGKFNISSIYEKELKTMRDLAVQNQAYKLEQEGRLKEALGLLAAFKDKEFAYNESGKYLDEKADWLARQQMGFDYMYGGMANQADAARSESNAGGTGLNSNNGTAADPYKSSSGTSPALTDDWMNSEWQNYYNASSMISPSF